MISWHYLSKADYMAASTAEKTADKLFFLSDTHEIYRGTELFSQACELVDADPTTPAVGRLYINSSTLEGKIYNGTEWKQVIKPVAAAVTADGVNPVSGAAVATYVGERIAEVTGSSSVVTGIAYDAATAKLTATMGDGSTTPLVLEKLGVDLTYDQSTGALQLKDIAGNAIGSAINLDLERFVSEASYDHASGTITLKFNDESDALTIDIGDLVDTYTAKATSTVDLSVANNEFTAAVKVSAEAGNKITVKDDGLFCDIDLSGKMDKDTDAVAGNLAKFDGNGNAVDAGLVAGGATLAAAPAATTLATEAAVEAIRSALQTAIDGKIAKMAAGDADKVVLSTADGQVARSAMGLGGATLAAAPDAATLATEAAVAAAIKATGDTKVAKDDVAVTLAANSTAASEEKVASEKAVVSAMEWKTSV